MTENVPIFLSYADADEEWARRLMTELGTRSVESLHPPLPARDDGDEDDDWIETMIAAMNRSRCVVFIVTPEAVRSERVAFELGGALALKKEVIPVVFPGTPAERVPGPLRLRKWIEKREPRAVAADVARRIAA
jgi:nucleoside 2-deoxyribosyltransferase